MNFKFCLINFVRFSFRKKKFVALAAIFLLTANFGAANESDKQGTSAESRQLIKQAEKMTRRGELPEAEKMLRGWLENSPQDSAAKICLSSNLLKQRRVTEAYDLAYEVASSESKNSHAFAVLGAILLDAGHFREAENSSVNAVNLDAHEALGWANLGLLDFYENRIFQGLNGLRTAVNLSPNEPDFIYSLAQVSARAELYNEAANAYNDFLRISPRTDVDRRERIKGLIDFLHFLGSKQKLYEQDGAKQTVVSFELKNDRPVIKLRINKTGEPLNFVLDTGAGMSVLSEETAKKLHIKPVARGGSARGIGGDGKFDVVYGFLKSIYIGDVQIRSVPIFIRKFHQSNEGTDGYIGLSLISKFLTTIDYGEKTFELTSKNLADKRPVEKDKLSLPLRLTSSGFLSGEVELEGIQSPLNFIVDTGASVSVISEAVAQTREISLFVKKDEKMRVIGAAGVTDSVPLFVLPSITFGTHRRQNVKAVALDLNLINESAGFEQSGILGGNFLKSYRLTFDFQNSQVIFDPIK